jgi:ribosome-associated toxin RatA of RatAB toxin-antitoxin module
VAQAERTEVVDLPLEAIFNVIKSYEEYPQFVSGMKSTQVQETFPDGSKKVFFDIDLVRRVQYSVRIKDSITESRDSARVEWSLIESQALKVSNGLWVLKSIGPQSTEVTYKLEVEFNFPAPGFVVKGLIATSMPLAIKEFKNRALKNKKS